MRGACAVLGAVSLAAVVAAACTSPTSPSATAPAIAPDLSPSPFAPGDTGPGGSSLAGSASPSGSGGPLATARVYLVASGDTLLRIATRFGLTVEQLLAWNPQIVDPDRIRQGDPITIPAAGATLPPPSVLPGTSVPATARWREWSSREALFSVRLPPDWIALTFEDARSSRVLAALTRRYPARAADIHDWAARLTQAASPQELVGLIGGPEAADPPSYEIEIRYRLAALDATGFDAYVSSEVKALRSRVPDGAVDLEGFDVTGTRAVKVTVRRPAGSDDTLPTAQWVYYVEADTDLYLVTISAFRAAPDAPFLGEIVRNFVPAPAPPEPGSGVSPLP